MTSNSKSIYNGDIWTLKEIEKFIETLMDLTLSNDIKELKYLFIPKCVWEEMEKELGVDHDVLKNFWNCKLHMQLFCCQPIYLNDLKIKLIEYLYAKGISESYHIKWNKVISKFDGMTKHFLYKTYTNLIQQAKERTDCTNLLDLVDFLYNHHIQYLITQPEDKILPRLIYTKNNIEYVHKDLEEVLSFSHKSRKINTKFTH